VAVVIGIANQEGDGGRIRTVIDLGPGLFGMSKKTVLVDTSK